ncbi:mevalonate kinase [Limosilactobacillus reuteri]|uniref:Mevalonate kinase n=1 Tax=Limosilactobacillus reuteri TaxID=1598 RepID=A0AAX2SSU5_LIMRT|nr:mevalonate kinase [Limosilactobacillus reuteri]MCC4326949.1 mevalonate kinase [Limosilactobacillus reuteri]MCC4335005.1 mevalonate kinase [Limosilactobacillus reuteri]MCC4337348.1 mevalonate kinase [Limosilactobacillus reuteri]MCC4347537.1 mevalonate kinase [Limosilactobacillus reuteri]MCC4375149.1 mevalonate kinase [Limosilactobacillus reuteri]
MVKQQGIGTSHAKIILMGEHSVVYGQPAIALPLPSVQLSVTLSSRQDNQRIIKSRYYHGSLENLPSSMIGIKKLIDTLSARFNDHETGWDLKIESQLPAERGMGSSAASAIAIIRAFFDYYDEPLDRTLLLQLADVEEQITHRSPSGLDAATVSSDKPLFYVKGRIGVPIEMNLDASLVIADTGKKGATKEAILAVKDELKNNNEKAEEHIKHLGELVNQTKDYLAQNDIVKLGDAFNFAQTDLAALNVSDPSLDHLIHVARDNGALGAKLTGGGRGGCMIALMQTAMGARRLASILKENGAHDIWLQPLDKRGNN